MPQPPYHLPAVRLSADDYVAVNFRLWRARPATRRNHWLLGAALALLAVSIGLDLWQHGQLTSTFTPLFLGVGVAYGLLRFGLVRGQLRRGYARQSALQQPIDFTLSADKISGRSALGHFSGQWVDVQRAVWVESDWLLLYPSETACYYPTYAACRPPPRPPMWPNCWRSTRFGSRRCSWWRCCR